MKILFSMRHLGSFRMYESVVRQLAARRNQVHIVIDRGERMGWRTALEQLMADCPTVTWSWSPTQRRRLWFELSRTIRIWLDYLRYFDPAYDTTPILRRRAGDRMPRQLVRMTDAWPLGTRAGRAVLRRLLRAAERALPRIPEIDESLRRQMPDVMLLTPLIYLGSPQLELLRSAKALGIRTALCVGSWDHLSSKALIRDVPRQVMVWNDTQRDELVQLHGVPAEQVVVTGAQCYDEWFARSPSRSREQFCADVGLRPDRPFIVWVCSALFHGSPQEAAFVVSWIESLRNSEYDALRQVGILVRPHPARMHEWKQHDLSRFENVSLYGSNPVDRDSKNDYFDSLSFSAAVAGLNTSAFLEASIVGRPVHTILPPQYYDNQEGTLHFHYLLDVAGGLLRAARDVDTHHRQLVESVEGRAGGNPAFVKAFIRPHGLEVPATDVFVSAVEALAAEPRPEPERVPAHLAVLRGVLLPLALVARAVLGRRADAEDKTSREILGARIKERRAKERLRRARLAEEADRRRQRERERQKAAILGQRLAARDERRQDRERLAAESRHRKSELRRKKAREKQIRLKRKRLVALRQRIMHKLGLA